MNIYLLWCDSRDSCFSQVRKATIVALKNVLVGFLWSGVGSYTVWDRLSRGQAFNNFTRVFFYVPLGWDTCSVSWKKISPLKKSGNSENFCKNFPIFSFLRFPEGQHDLQRTNLDEITGHTGCLNSPFLLSHKPLLRM